MEYSIVKQVFKIISDDMGNLAKVVIKEYQQTEMMDIFTLSDPQVKIQRKNNRQIL